MPYHVAIRGAEVKCDTVAELKALLSEIGFGFAEPPSREDGVTSMVPDPDFLSVLSDLSRTQMAFLELLAKGETTDSDARTALGLETNKQLAGVLAAIAKKFKGAGLANPVQTESRFKDGNRLYRYWLSPDDKYAVHALLGAPRTAEYLRSLEAAQEAK